MEKAYKIAGGSVLALVLGLLLLFALGVLSNSQWFWALLVIFILGIGGLLFIVNLSHQVDDNPYYTDMVKAKRDEVRRLRKIKTQ